MNASSIAALLLLVPSLSLAMPIVKETAFAFEVDVIHPAGPSDVAFSGRVIVTTDYDAETLRIQTTFDEFGSQNFDTTTRDEFMERETIEIPAENPFDPPTFIEEDAFYVQEDTIRFAFAPEFPREVQDLRRLFPSPRAATAFRVNLEIASSRRLTRNDEIIEDLNPELTLSTSRNSVFFVVECGFRPEGCALNSQVRVNNRSDAFALNVPQPNVGIMSLMAYAVGLLAFRRGW